jgi:hypothetical protein
MRDEQEVERLAALARSLGLRREDLAGALDVLEEDLPGGGPEVAEVEGAKAGGLEAEVAFLLTHSAGAAEVEQLLLFLARGGDAGGGPG